MILISAGSAIYIKYEAERRTRELLWDLTNLELGNEYFHSVSINAVNDETSGLAFRTQIASTVLNRH